MKGFLNTKKISSCQADLGIEVILSLFTKAGLTRLFAELEGQFAKPNTQSAVSSQGLPPSPPPPLPLSPFALSDNARRIIAMQDHYINSIDAVIAFLQGKNPTLAHLICLEDFLPEASRFAQLDDMEWAFGSMGIQDKAKHLATLYLEDLGDLITECVDEHFGFSRYAERLGRSANSFDELYEALQQPPSFIDHILQQILEKRMAEAQPRLVCVSVPFPGNLYSAFRCAQWIKQNYPEVKTAMGGGFANTELRSLSEPRVFEFFDFITLDDGEAPIENLVEHIEGKRPVELLKRTFVMLNGRVDYINNSFSKDYKQSETGTPDYSDLPLDKYISVLEIANPMHRLWSDGRWNKLTMAHGCYWGKCTFCDISLDYIKVYEPVAAKMLCDRIEEMIAQTGENGFHFVDEAAPPALMRALALEILRRKLSVSWWTNIRFEKSFTRDLCRLLKASGCIAVTGGLEVASDRLLKLIDKGVTVAQVAQVTRNFTESGIMTHAYLMYGFPTQTDQETIDSLEIVRQLFEAGVLQSAFWHQFAMTAHSPVGLYPEKFGVKKKSEVLGSFANNDIEHIDPQGGDHEKFSYGLKKSLLNYMHGIGLDYPLQDWFDFKTPRTQIDENHIESILAADHDLFVKPAAKLVWLGPQPAVRYFTKNKKGKDLAFAELTFHTKKEPLSIRLDEAGGRWLAALLPRLSASNSELLTFQQIQADYESAGLIDFEVYWYEKLWDDLHGAGLLAL